MAGMKISVRLLASCLVLVFMASMGTWFYSTALQEDALFETERVVVAMNGEQLGATDADARHAIADKSVCNHGCHYLNHFQGELRQDSTFSSVHPVGEAIVTRILPIPHVSPEQALRPPRLPA